MRELFTSKPDPDGDIVEGSMTDKTDHPISIGAGDGAAHSEYAYLSREGAAELRDWLSEWLEENPA